MSPLTITKKFVDAINSNDANKMAELMTENHTFIDADGSEHSRRENMRKGWKEHFKLIPDLNIKILEHFEKGNTVMLYGIAKGTIMDKGELKVENHWQVPAAWRVVVENGKVAIWQLFASQEEMIKIYERIKKAK